MTRRQFFTALFVAAGTAALLTGSGCGPRESGGPAVSASPGASAGPAKDKAATHPPGEKLALRLSYFPNITHAPALIGVGDGTFARAVGDRATITPRVFLDGPSQMEALLAGEIDIAYVGISPALNAYVKSEGALKIVSGAASGGAVLVARAGSGINRMEDLVGKRIGTPKKGGTQDIAARFYITRTLNQKLSEQGGTTQIIPTESPQLAQLFDRKGLDAAWMQEPWGTRLIQEQKAKLILDERSVWPTGRYATTVIVARTEFLKQHPDLVEKIVGAHITVADRLNQDRQGAISLLNEQIKKETTRGLAPEIIAESLKRIDFTHDPYVETIQVQAERAFLLGFLGRKKPDISGLVDNAPLTAALAASKTAATTAKEGA